MATLRGLVRKFGRRGAARVFSSSGYPHAESSIRSALKNPKGKGFARLNEDAGNINIRRAKDPGERAVSSTKPKNANAPRERKVLFGKRTGLEVGRQDVTRKNGTTQKFRQISKHEVDGLIVEALAQYGPDRVWSVAFYGGVYAEVEHGSDISLEVHRRWITITAPGSVVMNAAQMVTATINADREDIGRFVTDPKERATQRRLVTGSYAVRLAEALTPYQWAEVQAMWIAPAKEFV